MSVRHLYLIGAAAILGCGPPPPDLSGASALPKSGTLLTAVEIAAAKADNGTAFEAVQRLRPNWLAARGTMSSNVDASQYATVFLDGQQFGTIDALRRIAAYHVANIRYHDITQAGARFGIRGGMGGVIEVISK
jgi:hypothetical protein